MLCSMCSIEISFHLLIKYPLDLFCFLVHTAKINCQMFKGPMFVLNAENCFWWATLQTRLQGCTKCCIQVTIFRNIWALLCPCKFLFELLIIIALVKWNYQKLDRWLQLLNFFKGPRIVSPTHRFCLDLGHASEYLMLHLWSFAQL